MAKIVYGLNQSLDGYIDHQHLRPSPGLFRHFTEHMRALNCLVYGRRTYEVMRYWDEDVAGWGAQEHEYAAVWRSKPKWVMSRSLHSVGPNARLVGKDIESVIGGLRTELDGEIDVAGPDLAASLSNRGLVDEYQLYVHPDVLGHGKPFFAGRPPSLRFVASDRITDEVIRLTYVPADAAR